MKKSKLSDLAKALNSGVAIDSTLFDTFLQMAKNIRESSRDWVILRTHDTSITFSASDTYTSTKTLPSRFLRVFQPYEDRGNQNPAVFITDSAGNKTALNPIPFVQRFDYKDVDGYYYIDLKNNTIGRTGRLAGTLNLYYLQGTADITDDLEWTFPSFAHPLLAFDVVIISKGGVDWDTVNANQVGFNQQTVREIESALAMWDARLQAAELGF